MSSVCCGQFQWDSLLLGAGVKEVTLLQNHPEDVCILRSLSFPAVNSRAIYGSCTPALIFCSVHPIFAKWFVCILVWEAEVACPYQQREPVHPFDLHKPAQGLLPSPGKPEGMQFKDKPQGVRLGLHFSESSRTSWAGATKLQLEMLPLDTT